MRKDKISLALISGGTVAGSLIVTQQSASAIDVATVSSDIADIIVNTDAAADVAWPIGAALIALFCIGTVFRRFLMGTGR